MNLKKKTPNLNPHPVNSNLQKETHHPFPPPYKTYHTKLNLLFI